MNPNMAKMLLLVIVFIDMCFKPSESFQSFLSKDIYVSGRLALCNKMATPWSVEEFFNDDADVGSNKDERKTTRSTSNSRSHSPLPRAQNSAKPTRASINTGKRAMKRNAQVEFFATCISGMEKILLEEIKALTEVDPSSIRIGKSGVHYSGSMVIYVFSLVLWYSICI